MSSTSSVPRPVFSTPARWALRVLSWLAFGIAAYLAWNSINQTSVAGCSVGGHNGCDAVLDSPWSKWLGLPVAVAGLGCYAALAGLSVLLGVRDIRMSRVVNTAFIMLAVLAAGASLWFIAIQAVVIGDFCLYCLATDICGIAIGTIAVWSAALSRNAVPVARGATASSANLMALRSALPTASPVAPAAVQPRIAPPSLAIAFSGAAVLLIALIGGQVVFRAKTYDVQQVALDESIDMTRADAAGSTGDEVAPKPSDTAATRVAMRLPAEVEEVVEPQSDAPPQAAVEGSGDAMAVAPEAEQEVSTSDQQADSPSKRERKVTLLNGKLTLDLYSQPVIGSRQAPHVVVELIAYDCIHCRKMHSLMKRAMTRYNGQVVLVVLPVPLEKSCNRLIQDPAASHAGACTTARLALGVAELKPSSFKRFHDFLMSGKDEPPPLDSIIAKAYSIADRSRLREMLSSKELDEQIAANVNLFDTIRKQNVGNKEFGLPIQILGDHLMSGSVEQASDIYAAWEEHLGVTPR